MVLLREAVHRYSPLASALGEGGGEQIVFGKFDGMASVLGKLKFDDEKGLTRPLMRSRAVLPKLQTAQNSMPALLCLSSQ